MRLSSIAKIKNSTTRKRDEITGASECFDSLTENWIGVIGSIGLCPLNLTDNADLIKDRIDNIL